MLGWALLAVICWQPIYYTVMSAISFVQTGQWSSTYSSKVSAWFGKLLSLVFSAP